MSKLFKASDNARKDFGGSYFWHVIFIEILLMSFFSMAILEHWIGFVLFFFIFILLLTIKSMRIILILSFGVAWAVSAWLLMDYNGFGIWSSAGITCISFLVGLGGHWHAFTSLAKFHQL